MTGPKGELPGSPLRQTQSTPPPPPVGQVGTHWADCWRVHLDCACNRIERLAGCVRLQRLALAEIAEKTMDRRAAARARIVLEEARW